MEEKKKVPKLLIAVTIIAILAFIGAISDLGNSSGEVQTVSQSKTPDIEKTLGGKKASIDQTFFYEIDDGSINGFTILSVKKYDSYAAGSTTINNAIVFETNGVRDSVDQFLTNKAFVTSCNKDGKIKTDYNSGAWSNSDRTYCVFYSDSSVADQYYISLGGFAQDKNNGESVFIFDIE